MSAIKNFVGIDISKGWLDFAATSLKSKKLPLEFRLDNSTQAVRDMEKILRKGGITMGKKTLVTFEHIGNYARPLIRYLTSKGCLICQESALRIKRSLGIQRGKSDSIDARRILDYAIKNAEKLRIWKTPKPIILLLKDLLAMRDRFIKIDHMLKVPIADKKDFLSKKYIASLTKIQTKTRGEARRVLVQLKSEIANLIAQDSEIKHKVDLITTIPGIGLITAAHLTCATRGFTAFSNGKQLACYAGCVPFPHSSGTSVKGKSRISQVANKKIKALMHLAALTSIKPRAEFKKYFDRKVKEGKPTMLVLNAIRCKLLMRIASVIKNDRAYMTPQKFNRFQKKLNQHPIAPARFTKA